MIDPRITCNETIPTPSFDDSTLGSPAFPQSQQYPRSLGSLPNGSGPFAPENFALPSQPSIDHHMHRYQATSIGLSRGALMYTHNGFNEFISEHLGDSLSRRRGAHRMPGTCYPGDLTDPGTIQTWSSCLRPYGLECNCEFC